MQTGPKTRRGRANSSKNAQTHGLLSLHLIVAGESRDEFDQLLATLLTELRPVGLLENTLAERIAVTLWRQRRLVRAESASIALRAEEKSGQVVFALKDYLADAKGLSNAQEALEADSDQNDLSAWIQEVADFDAGRPDALRAFARRCPMAFETLSDQAADAEISVEDYLETEFAGLDGFVQWYRSQLEPQLKMAQTVSKFRDSRALPANPEIFIRYQSGLDNELYKAMRALREAQTWRLSTIDEVKPST